MANILYFGADDPSSTSRHRAEALRRLGHEVTIADPYAAVGLKSQSHLVSAFHFRTGYRFLQSKMMNWIAGLAALHRGGEIAWVDGGELLGPDCLRMLGTAGLVTVLYNHDDPTGKRDGHRFDTLLAALPYYDVCAVVRQENAQEYKDRGARLVVSVYRSFDEVMHAPFPDPTKIPEGMRSEVSFIGTWMRDEGRDIFLLALIDRGIPLSIWGDRWQKSAWWERLKGHYRGEALGGRDYVAAIQGAKVCLGLLSKGNRDLHTTRSMEIPFAGGVLCAKRTNEHLALFKEGVEAVFWGDAQECAERCRQLLDDPKWRESVRRAGMARVRGANLGNEDLCRKIMEAVS